MKFQNLLLFKKSIANLHSHHFLIVIEDEYERNQVIDWIVSTLPKGFVSRFSASSSWEALLAGLWENSLWGEVPILIVDELEKRKKEEIDKLISEAFVDSFSGYLILGAKGKVSCAEHFEKNGVVFDLSLEKPWDRKKRFAEAIAEKCAAEKKSISLSAGEKLLESASDDVSFLGKEIDKILSYVGDKKTNQHEDVMAISSWKEKTTVWHLADRLIWKEDKKEEPVEHLLQDSSFFHTFLGALRYQLQLGYKLSIAGGKEDVSFSKVPAKILEKRKEKASVYGKEYFREGLSFLYRMDVLSKSGVDLELLFDRISAYFLQYDKNSVSSS
ncbi:MAG: hypothetical protein WCP39_04190 [Chlamydiota bacterium]